MLRFLMLIAVLLTGLAGGFITDNRTALAAVCEGCNPLDCERAKKRLRDHHEEGERDIVRRGDKNLYDRMLEHKQTTLDDFFDALLPNLVAMTQQMSAMAIDQMRVIGFFFDAKHELETQLTLQEMQFQAAKRYYPSESFCSWGTVSRSLADSESRGLYNQSALAQLSLKRQLGNANMASAGEGEDILARWKQFTSAYCDPHNNNWRGPDSQGLALACGGGASDPDRINKDINFTLTVDSARTLSIDLNEAGMNPDEEDVLALAHNLYGHNPVAGNIAGANMPRTGGIENYMLLRSIAAKRAVAQESYNAIVGMKAEAEDEGDTAPFLAAILRDSGFKEDEIFDYLGEKPSYYAQLEVLGKKMYQNPEFFVDLYGQPDNIKRKKAAMNAIELMLDRALFESELRQEMIMSVLISARNWDDFGRISDMLGKAESRPGDP